MPISWQLSFLAAATLLALSAGCPPVDETQDEKACAPGDVETCPCLAGGTGVQSCKEDGSGWSSCACPGQDGGAQGSDAGVDAGRDAGADASADASSDAGREAGTDGAAELDAAEAIDAATLAPYALQPGDTVGYSKLNIYHCPSSSCVPDNEVEAAWKATYVIEEGGVQFSQEARAWEVEATYFHEVIEGAAGVAGAEALGQTWLSAFGPYDQALGYVGEGVGSYSTSSPPLPGAEPLSFPFFDLANQWDVGAARFREHVLAIDPDAVFDIARASRRFEAYYVDAGPPSRVHHVWIIFHSVGIVCSFDEEIADAPGEPTRSQADFTDVIVTPKANVSFAWIQRRGGAKQFCSCASDTGCE